MILPPRTATIPAVLLTAALAATAAAQVPAPTITKSVRQCLTPCGRAVRSAPGFTTVTYEITVINNSEDTDIRLQVTDDIPAGAVGFRVTDRGFFKPCGAPGDPTCNNIPAPGGANGTGKVVIDNFTLQRATRPLGSVLTVVIEVDFACPPLVTGDTVANQARIFSPDDPAICNPCLSDDPSTPAADDPTNFRAVCQPPPPFTVFKTPSVTEWRPGDSPVIDYTIEIRNDSPTDTILGANLNLNDRLPTLSTGTSAVSIPDTCPVAVTSNPPATLLIDNDFCNWNQPFITITGLPDIPPLGSTFLDFPVTILTDLVDGFDICNQVFVAQSGGAMTNAVACTKVVRPFPADFRDSTKSASPDPASPGDPVTYTLTVRNTGQSPGTRVVLSDVLPACVNDAAFNPATDVTVSSPGPGGPVTYDRPTRTLRVPIGNVAVNQTFTITVQGLTAGAETAACCNQAYIAADGIPAPGQPTGTAAATGAPACIAIAGGALPSFTRSTKVAAPSPVTEGSSLNYTLTIENSGAAPASDVVVTDVFPPCLDDVDFDAATDVTILPGPGTATYDRPSRTLTVSFATLPAASTQTVTILDLTAGAPTGSCCNQAFTASREVPSPGQPTGATPGSGSPTCVAINPAAVGCDLGSAATTTRAQIGPAYSQGCPGDDPRIFDLSPLVDIVTGQVIDTVSIAPSPELVLYQLECACANVIRLYKDAAATPTSVRIEF